MGYSKEEILDYLHKFEMGWENPAKYVSSKFWFDVQNLIKSLDAKNDSSVSESCSLLSDILNGKDIRTAIMENSQGVVSVNEGRKFVVGDSFKFTDKYGAKHECKVLAKDLFDEMDYDDYAIGTLTFSYPTLGSPHKETVRLYKEDFGDEYFVSGVSSTGGKSGFGIEHIVKP